MKKKVKVLGLIVALFGSTTVLGSNKKIFVVFTDGFGDVISPAYVENNCTGLSSLCANAYQDGNFIGIAFYPF